MKKAKWIIIAVVIILVVAVGGVCLWASYNPQVNIVIGRPVEKDDLYVEMITTGYSDTLNIPANKKIKAQLDEIYDTVNNECMRIQKNCEAPTHIEIELSKDKDGKTVVTLYGTVTQNNITTEYNKKFTFDYKQKGDFN